MTEIYKGPYYSESIVLSPHDPISTKNEIYKAPSLIDDIRNWAKQEYEVNADRETAMLATRFCLIPSTLQQVEQHPEYINYLQQSASLSTREKIKKLVIIAYDDHEMKETMMNEINGVTRSESLSLIEQETIETPVLVIGTGPTGTANGLGFPSGSVLFIDDRMKRGGQFGRESISYPVDIDRIASPNALIQLRDFPNHQKNNYIFADIVSINSFFHGIAITDLEAESPEITNNDLYPYNVQAKIKSKQSNDFKLEKHDVTITPKVIIYAPGSGRPKEIASTVTKETGSQSIFNTESFSQKIVTSTPEEILSMIEGKLAIIGSGDTAKDHIKEILNYLTTLSDEKIEQLSQESRIQVYGKSYALDNKIKPFLDKFSREKAVFKTNANTVISLQEVAEQKIQLNTPQGVSQAFKTVACLIGIDLKPLRNFIQNIKGFQGVQELYALNDDLLPMGLQVANQRIYIAGNLSHTETNFTQQETRDTTGTVDLDSNKAYQLALEIKQECTDVFNE